MVGIREGDDAAQRGARATIAQRGNAAVFRIEDDGAVIAGNAARAIGRLVIDDDDLNELAGIVITSDAREASLQSLSIVLDGDDKRNEWSHGRQFSKELAKCVQTRNSRRYALISQSEDHTG